MESKEEDKEENKKEKEEKEENYEKYVPKKRKREEGKEEGKERKGARKTKQKILNEYYNLTPVIKIENNVRLIEPYEFKYQLYIKRRWLGKKIIDVLDSEFHAFPKEYYSKAISDKHSFVLLHEILKMGSHFLIIILLYDI